ncbi:MAG TPA: hypothetical protein VGD56_06350, partial [Gemmatirosa sp.]
MTTTFEPRADDALPRAERLVVGVDGGGSKTRALVARPDGTVVGSADGPGSAVRGGGVQHSVDVIAACVRDALAAAGDADARPAALAAGVAGV